MSTLTESVRKNYAAVAASKLSSQDAGVRAVAEAFGYSTQELAGIPDEANMGLSCGNPTAMASLRPGEVVVDLGSGGGLDVFLAAQKVGPAGRAIGIDMTPEMIERARRNARGIDNVEFHLSTIDKLPLPDASADVIISNCVINLAEDKSAVFREMFRVLKPGGRVAVSDIALKRALPPAIASAVASYVGCIGGALQIGDYEKMLKAAGFSAVQVIDSGADLNAYTQVEGQSGCCSPAGGDAGGGGCCAPVMGRAPASPHDERRTSNVERSSSSHKAQSEVPGADARAPITVGAACCTPHATPGACCNPSETAAESSEALAHRTERDGAPAPESHERPLHESLSDLLAHHNVNDYAASVKVFAVKP